MCLCACLGCVSCGVWEEEDIWVRVLFSTDLEFGTLVSGVWMTSNWRLHLLDRCDA